jgi:FkbM family methyltransferase
MKNMGYVGVKFRNTSFKFYHYKNDYLFKRMRKTGKIYESEYLNHIYKYHRHTILGKRVIDVGANIGTHSIFFSKICKALVVQAFEPIIKLKNIAKYNRSLNNISYNRIEILPIALNNRKDLIKLVASQKNNMGTYRKDGMGLSSYLVNCYPFDCLAYPENSVNLAYVKIDVEGMELNVIQGMIETLKKFQPVIGIESWDIKESINTILPTLNRIGYKWKYTIPGEEKGINILEFIYG